MGWSITPSDLASIDSNGHVTFSRHTERDITYTITYSDSNFTCSKSCTVYKCPDPCTCANANFNVSVAPDGIDIPASGYTNLRTIGTYNSATCLTGITATSSENWITDITVGGGNIRAKATENTSLTQGRQSTITVTGKDGSGTNCPATFIVTQVVSASSCSCASITFQADATAAASQIQAEGYSTSTVLGTYTYPTCLTNITATSNKNWITITNVSNGNVSATVSENASLTDSRTAIITVSGVDAYGETCSDPFDVSQRPSASTCTCENVDLHAEATVAGNSIPSTGYAYSTIIGTYNNSTCLTSLGVTKNQTWVTDLSISGGNVHAKIQANTDTVNSRQATITVSGKDAYDVTCTSPFTITQQPNACITAVTQLMVEVDKDCEAIPEDITNCAINDIYLTSCTASGEEVVTKIWSYSDKKTTYCNNNPYPKNTGTTPTDRTDDLWFVPGEGSGGGRFYNYEPTGSSPRYSVGSIKVTQSQCETECKCIPGSDNYIVKLPSGRWEYHYLPVNAHGVEGPGTDAHAGDTNRCGFQYGNNSSNYWITAREEYWYDCNEDIHYNVGEPWVTINTAQTTATDVVYNMKANNSLFVRYSIITVTHGTKGQDSTCQCSGTTQKFCDEWQVAFSQAASGGCGCNMDVGWTANTISAIPASQTKVELGRFVKTGCWEWDNLRFGVAHDDDRNPKDVYPWVTSYVYSENISDNIYGFYINIEPNTSGASRAAGIYICFVLNDCNLTVCEHQLELIQLG